MPANLFIVQFPRTIRVQTLYVRRKSAKQGKSTWFLGKNDREKASNEKRKQEGSSGGKVQDGTHAAKHRSLLGSKHNSVSASTEVARRDSHSQEGGPGGDGPMGSGTHTKQSLSLMLPPPAPEAVRAQGVVQEGGAGIEGSTHFEMEESTKDSQLSVRLQLVQPVYELGVRKDKDGNGLSVGSIDSTNSSRVKLKEGESAQAPGPDPGGSSVEFEKIEGSGRMQRWPTGKSQEGPADDDYIVFLGGATTRRRRASSEKDAPLVAASSREAAE
ncbi:unnamed protein product, partial [Discosporangium mesarthrocarpum]